MAVASSDIGPPTRCLTKESYMAIVWTCRQLLEPTGLLGLVRVLAPSSVHRSDFQTYANFPSYLCLSERRSSTDLTSCYL
jgi:hypothetical protein